MIACWSDGPQAQQPAFLLTLQLVGEYLMKRFFASCAAVAVGILLAGPVHAESGKSGKGSGHAGNHRSGSSSRPHAGHYWRAFRPAPWQIRRQWLPEQSPDVVIDDTSPAGVDVIPGNADPNLGGDNVTPGGEDTIAVDSEPNQEVIGGNVMRPKATPKGRASGQMDKVKNRAPGVTKSQPTRR
jgi:hypothetical protein